jgi:hypothetical protein
MEWSTEVPPKNCGEVFVLCGNGEVRVDNADQLTQEFYGLCWIAWSK